MKQPSLALIAFALFVSACTGAEPACGMPVNGVRLGISVAGAPADPALRVVLENVSTTRQEIVMGIGKSAYFKFFATCATGLEVEGVELGNFLPIAGFVSPPVSVVLQPGATHEVEFKLARIIHARRQGDTTFDKLAREPQFFHVSLEVNRENSRGASMLSVWFGKVTSPRIGFKSEELPPGEPLR